MAKPSSNTPRPRVRPSAGGRHQTSPSASAGGHPLVSRRAFLYGALGAGAVAAVGIGGGAYSSLTSDDEIVGLDVPLSSLSTLGEFEALENADDQVRLVGKFDLPYGTLLWANDDSVAACLLPTDLGSPLAQIGLLFLGSGYVATAREEAVGSAEGYEIYDVRATSSGMVWTEANILQGTWRIYTATVSTDQIGEAQLVDEGDDTYDTPTLAAVDKRAFWQVLPKATNSDGLTSRLMGSTFGTGTAEIVYESNRRMATPPYGADGTITIAPRVDSPSLYYELVNLDAKTGDTRDSLILPHGIVPIESGYGETGFMFSFPDIYDYDSAISNLGTYVARSLPADGNYSSVTWFDFARTPTAAPAWCDDLLIVKSTYSVCGVDLARGTYFAIDVEDGADTYGEYLASTGARDTFVTYTNMDHTPINEERIYACRVKVWARA